MATTTRRAPPLLAGALALALAAQVAWHASHPARPPGPDRLGAPAPLTVLRLVSLGETPALSKGLMLALQANDAQAGGDIALGRLDYRRVVPWLQAALELDPRGQYPLLAASGVYGAVADPVRIRMMLDFVSVAFERDPARRWPWLAQAAVTAKHRLHDLPLARRYARAIRLRAPGAPLWARELEAFILQDMNEADAARAVIGGLLDGGQVTDPREMRLLERRLEELER